MPFHWDARRGRRSNKRQMAKASKGAQEIRPLCREHLPPMTFPRKGPLRRHRMLGLLKCSWPWSWLSRLCSTSSNHPPLVWASQGLCTNQPSSLSPASRKSKVGAICSRENKSLYTRAVNPKGPLFSLGQSRKTNAQRGRGEGG